MPNKKDVLLEEEEKPKEHVLLVDETGKELTYEEALEEEKRLESMLENFFVNNPALIQNEAQEQEDDEDITITVDEKGTVVKEEIIKTEEAEPKEILVQAKPSMVDQHILKMVILQHRKELAVTYSNIREKYTDFMFFSKGDKMEDNLTDMYRKESRELSDLLSQKEISLDSMENEVLKGILEQKVMEFLSNMFETIQELNN